MDRLALISKIFLDNRFLELKSENSNLTQQVQQLKAAHTKLKLDVFWYRYSSDVLKDRMIFGNFSNEQTGPRCTCRDCKELGRLDDTHPVDETIQACRFKPWIDQLVESCSMTVKFIFYGPEPLPPDHVYDYDAHFIVYFKDNWDFFIYGHKLTQATSVSCREIQKLFQLLKGIYCNLPFDPRLPDYPDYNQCTCPECCKPSHS